MSKFMSLSRLITLLALLFIALPASHVFAQEGGAPAATEPAATDSGTEDAGSSTGFFSVVASGGFVGIVLWIAILCTSLAGFALIGDSFVTVREDKIIPEGLVARVNEAMEQGDVVKAQNICAEEPGPMANILSAAFENIEGGFEAVQDSVAIAADLEAERLMQRVNYLNVVGNLAPMLGLLGTVQGMIYAFGTLSMGGAGKTAALAQNISQALYTTAAGLIIAIPALAFFYFFRNRASNIILKMESIALDQIKVLRHVEVVDEDE